MPATPQCPASGTGVETDRLQVTLATGISPEVCAQINVGYRDPASIPELMNDPNYTVIHDAGEVLFRVRGEQP